MDTLAELVSLLRGLSKDPHSSGSEEPDDPLLSTPEAAAYLGLADNTLSVWRCTGRYAIPYIKVGRLVKYRKSDLDAFLNRRTECQNEGSRITSAFKASRDSQTLAPQEKPSRLLPKSSVASAARSYHRPQSNPPDRPPDHSASSHTNDQIDNDRRQKTKGKRNGGNE